MHTRVRDHKSQDVQTRVVLHSQVRAHANCQPAARPPHRGVAFPPQAVVPVEGVDFVPGTNQGGHALSHRNHLNQPKCGPFPSLNEHGRSGRSNDVANDLGGSDQTSDGRAFGRWACGRWLSNPSTRHRPTDKRKTSKAQIADKRKLPTSANKMFSARTAAGAGTAGGGGVKRVGASVLGRWCAPKDLRPLGVVGVVAVERQGGRLTMDDDIFVHFSYMLPFLCLRTKRPSPAGRRLSCPR